MTKGIPQPNCFVISPIGEAGSDTRKHADRVLNDVIKFSLEPLGYRVARADKITEPGTISLQILKRIADSEIVVADLTGLNPNVMYELAIRHAVKKPVIILIRVGEKIPFDVATERAIFYDLDDSESIRSAKEELTQQAQFIQNNDFQFDTPLSLLDGLLSNQRSGPAQRKKSSHSIRKKSSKTKTFSLWDGLSDSIIIVYGAKYNQDVDKDGHLSLSLRDLNAAESIHAFFTRTYPKEKYPKKNFILMPALSNGWQTLLKENTDLIVIGGFVE